MAALSTDFRPCHVRREKKKHGGLPSARPCWETHDERRSSKNNTQEWWKHQQISLGTMWPGNSQSADQAAHHMLIL